MAAFGLAALGGDDYFCEDRAGSKHIPAATSALLRRGSTRKSLKVTFEAKPQVEASGGIANSQLLAPSDIQSSWEDVIVDGRGGISFSMTGQMSRRTSYCGSDNGLEMEYDALDFMGVGNDVDSVAYDMTLLDDVGHMMSSRQSIASRSSLCRNYDALDNPHCLEYSARRESLDSITELPLGAEASAEHMGAHPQPEMQPLSSDATSEDSDEEETACHVSTSGPGPSPDPEVPPKSSAATAAGAAEQEATCHVQRGCFDERAVENMSGPACGDSTEEASTANPDPHHEAEAQPLSSVATAGTAAGMEASAVCPQPRPDAEAGTVSSAARGAITAGHEVDGRARSGCVDEQAAENRSGLACGDTTEEASTAHPGRNHETEAQTLSSVATAGAAAGKEASAVRLEASPELQAGPFSLAAKAAMLAGQAADGHVRSGCVDPQTLEKRFGIACEESTERSSAATPGPHREAEAQPVLSGATVATAAGQEAQEIDAEARELMKLRSYVKELEKKVSVLEACHPVAAPSDTAEDTEGTTHESGWNILWKSVFGDSAILCCRGPRTGNRPESQQAAQAARAKALAALSKGFTEKQNFAAEGPTFASKSEESSTASTASCAQSGHSPECSKLVDEDLSVQVGA